MSCFAPIHECLVCEQRMGIAIIGDLDVRDLVCKPPFQANETFNSEFTGASALFDLVGVINNVNLRVDAF